MACVFGSLDGIKANFTLFYDLLAFEAVRGYRYGTEFQEAEGQPIRSSNFRSPIRQPESKNLLPADKLYDDIDRVMMSFFRDLSGDSDPELGRHCLVTSNESNQAREVSPVSPRRFATKCGLLERQQVARSLKPSSVC